MELVNRHAKRLGATFTVSIGEGTRYRFQVPVPDETPPPLAIS